MFHTVMNPFSISFAFSFLLSWCTFFSFAQKKLPSQYTPLSIDFNFGVQNPGGDLSKRFGTNLCVGVGFEQVFLPKGWIFGIQGNYIFGQTVIEDVLAPLRTPEGAVLGDIGAYASVELRERGYYVGSHFGKIFKLFDNGNRFHGIRATFGLGFMQHKIRIQDDNNSAPQVAPPYDAGYDRLTSGFALNQFIGYQVVSRDKKINFYAGFDFTEGFTKNRRGFNYDTRQRDDATRFDLLYGFRVGWSIPLTSNVKADDIEY
jgi:hypothetical protein